MNLDYPPRPWAKVWWPALRVVHRFLIWRRDRAGKAVRQRLGEGRVATISAHAVGLPTASVKVHVHPAPPPGHPHEGLLDRYQKACIDAQVVQAWLGYYNRLGSLNLWVGLPVLKDGLTHPPPRTLTRMMDLVLPAHLVGEFEEEYGQRELRYGRAYAVRWYWAQFARSIWPIVSTLLRLIWQHLPR